MGKLSQFLATSRLFRLSGNMDEPARHCDQSPACLKPCDSPSDYLSCTRDEVETAQGEQRAKKERDLKTSHLSFVCLKPPIGFQSHLENNPYSFLSQRAIRGYQRLSPQPSWISSERKSPNSGPPQNSAPALTSLFYLILPYIPLISFVHKLKHCFPREAFSKDVLYSSLSSIAAVLLTFYHLLLDLP